MNVNITMNGDPSTNPVSQAAKSERPHILIVDDDPEIIESLSIALRSKGFEVSSARDGNEGLAIAETKNPDLVILDLMMPKRSGFLVLERIRQTSRTPCPIIMITGNEGERHQEYAKMLGVSDYLHKPFTIDTLLKRVSELLDS